MLNPDALLARLTRICLALPEATCERAIRRGDAEGRRKTRRKAILMLPLRLSPPLGVSASKIFYLPAYVASRGWVGLRLDTGKIDWDEVRELVSDSYRRIAPKRLAAMVKLD